MGGADTLTLVDKLLALGDSGLIAVVALGTAFYVVHILRQTFREYRDDSKEDRQSQRESASEIAQAVAANTAMLRDLHLQMTTGPYVQIAKSPRVS